MKTSLIALSLALALAACGKKEDPYAGMQGSVPSQSASQPMQQAPVAQQQHQGFDWGTAALGAAAGYMLGSSGNKSQPQVIEREVIRDRNVYSPRPAVVPQPAPVQTPKFTAPAVPKPYVAPSTPVAPAVQPSKPNYGSGFSSYGSVKQSAPTYRSSPSFSSSRRR